MSCTPKRAKAADAAKPPCRQLRALQVCRGRRCGGSLWRDPRQSEQRRQTRRSRPAASCDRSDMRATGLEPARVLPHGNLNPVRLPIPPRPRRRRLYEKRPLSRFPSFVPTGDLPRFGLHSELVTVPAVRAPRPTSSPDLLVRVRHPPSTPVTGNPSTHEKS